MIKLILVFMAVGTFWIFVTTSVLAEEKPAPKPIADKTALEATKTTHDLPRDQVEAYGRLEAEGRALRAETTLALKEIEEKRAEILGRWKALVGGDLKGWQLDLTKGKLIRSNSPNER